MHNLWNRFDLYLAANYPAVWMSRLHVIAIVSVVMLLLNLPYAFLAPLYANQLHGLLINSVITLSILYKLLRFYKAHYNADMTLKLHQWWQLGATVNVMLLAIPVCISAAIVQHRIKSAEGILGIQTMQQMQRQDSLRFRSKTLMPRNKDTALFNKQLEERKGIDNQLGQIRDSFLFMQRKAFYAALISKLSDTAFHRIRTDTMTMSSENIDAVYDQQCVANHAPEDDLFSASATFNGEQLYDFYSYIQSEADTSFSVESALGKKVINVFHLPFTSSVSFTKVNTEWLQETQALRKQIYLNKHVFGSVFFLGTGFLLLFIGFAAAFLFLFLSHPNLKIWAGLQLVLYFGMAFALVYFGVYIYTDYMEISSWDGQSLTQFVGSYLFFDPIQDKGLFFMPLITPVINAMSGLFLFLILLHVMLTWWYYNLFRKPVHFMK